MNDTPQEALRRRMAEAAALPAHDEHRLAVAREVLEAGDWAEAEWLELIREDERLRLELLRVPPPTGMIERLRQIPREAPPVGIHWLRRAGSAAAALLLGIGLWLAVQQRAQNPSLDGRFQQLGLLAINHHNHHTPLGPSIRGSDRFRLAAVLDRRLHYDIDLPDLGGDFELLGVSVCKLGAHPVACTQWRKGDRTYTLLQLCQRDFELPERFAKQRVKHITAGQLQQAVFWTEKGCAYSLIADAGPSTK